MKPKFINLSTILIALVIVACAAEENTYVPEDTNEFNFNGATYPLITTIIVDENTASTEPSAINISLWNKSSSEATGNADLDDIALVNFTVEDVNLQNTTYNDIDSYSISTNGSVVDSEFNPGTILLSNEDPDADTFASSGSMSITNFTPYNIVFTFTFTRTDGQIISGSYDGNYLLHGF